MRFSRAEMKQIETWLDRHGHNPSILQDYSSPERRTRMLKGYKGIYIDDVTLEVFIREAGHLVKIGKAHSMRNAEAGARRLLYIIRAKRELREYMSLALPILPESDEVQLPLKRGRKSTKRKPVPNGNGHAVKATESKEVEDAAAAEEET